MASPPGQSDRGPLRLGVVSFLNSRPLIEGLTDDPRVTLRFAVPAALPGMLSEGEVDAALVPVIDLARSAGRWRRVSDACIGSDGRTLTVRVFSKVPPERMEVLHVDPDSHTSVALAKLIWANVYHRPLRIAPIVPVEQLRNCESVLLIGDKVVTTPMPWFDHHVDLGDAWKKWTGLPFVFAVWASRAEGASLSEPEAQARVFPEPGSHLPCATGKARQEARDRPADKPSLASDFALRATMDRCASGSERLSRILAEARDRGVARAAEIAAETGPTRGWPLSLAVEYMTRALMYKITPAAEAGMNRFFELLATSDIVPQARGLTA